MIGIESIIKKLRPNAEFELSNNEFSYYKDESGLPQLTWDEIYKELQKELENYTSILVHYQDNMKK